MTNYIEVLSTNYVGAQWTIAGNDYDTLNWLDNTPKPTQAELDAQWAGVRTAIAKAETDKQVARTALLDRLGITSDEAKLLLG